MLRGKLGASELCMHCRIVDNEQIMALVNEKNTYAYVLHKNNKTNEVNLTDGCFFLFQDNSCSIS